MIKLIDWMSRFYAKREVELEKEREIITVCSLLSVQWDEGEHLIEIMRGATQRYSYESPISFHTVWDRNWEIAKKMMSEGRWHFEIWVIRCQLGNYL